MFDMITRVEALKQAIERKIFPEEKILMFINDYKERGLLEVEDADNLMLLINPVTQE